MLSTLTDKVRPEHAAVLLVDVQNDFCADGGAMHREGRDMSLVQDMVHRLEKFVDGVEPPVPPAAVDARKPVLVPRSVLTANEDLPGPRGLGPLQVRREPLAQRAARRLQAREALVRIEAKHPVLLRMALREGTRRREVIAPFMVDHPGSRRASHLHRGIPAPRVTDDQVGNGPQALEGPRQVLLFVPDDEDNREHHFTRPSG